NGASGTLTESRGTFNLVINVAAEDTISFVVGDQNDVSGDETALRATITLSAPPVQSYGLTPASQPSGAGTIQADPAPVNGSYAAGTVVRLTATPAGGYSFSGWTGAISGSDNPISVTINRDLQVTAQFAPQPYAAAALADQPLVYYRFEEGAGSTVADQTAYHRNGTGAHLGAVAGASAALGKAVAFDGTSASIAVPALLDAQGNSAHRQLTIEAWVKIDSFDLPEGFGCIYNHDDWSVGSLHMQVNPGNLWEFSVNGSDPTDLYLGGPGLLKTGTWYHLVAVYDTDKGSLARYLNGQWLTNSVYNSCLSIDLGAAHIGAWNGTSRYIHAALDEFAIYPVALTADRVRTHYDAAVAGPEAGPSLSAAYVQGFVTLSWKATSPGFVLESTDSLSPPAQWQAVPNVLNSPISVPAQEVTRFYRLRK
ncbi:MAG: LamG-like jellyroll fold domain-containing protein, partial [Verrucomicrobiota bacterium]